VTCRSAAWSSQRTDARAAGRVLSRRVQRAEVRAGRASPLCAELVRLLDDPGGLETVGCFRSRASGGVG
jgi:hypothetical protein